MSEESIKNQPAAGNSFSSKKISYYKILAIKFSGNCLRQDFTSFIHRNIVDLYIA